MNNVIRDKNEGKQNLNCFVGWVSNLQEKDLDLWINKDILLLLKLKSVEEESGNSGNISYTGCDETRRQLQLKMFYIFGRAVVA